jgi:hypothetical protein
MLQWESFLNLSEMQKSRVKRLKRKHKLIMYILLKVGKRTAGMGFKVMKFHAILHLALDILMFGVPMVVDTGSNESHHKTTKVAARLTQKDIQTFEKQTSNRMDDFHVLDLAMEELAGRPLWEYFRGFGHDVIDQEAKRPKTKTGGMTVNVFKDEVTRSIEFRVVTRMEEKHKVLLDTQFLEFAYQLQEDLAEILPKMPIRAEHSREGVIFRSHPNYRGKGMWRDWVMIQWETGPYPAQIWGFVDLSSLPEGLHVDITNVHGVTEVQRGVFAIVESCDYEEEDEPLSDIFRPIVLETSSLTDGGEVDKRKFYLVDTECFKEPLVVVPDIGCDPKCKFLIMSPRAQWAEDFAAWLDMDHQIDEAEMQEEPLSEADNDGSDGEEEEEEEDA